MAKNNQQAICDRIYDARQQQQAAYDQMRRTGNTRAVVDADRKLGRLQNELNTGCVVAGLNDKFSD